jgi:CRISPR-associated protein Cmr3
MSLHEILLQPTDVLFFRDGRPMGGAQAGHTAAWPLPDVTNHALHAALHRAGLDKVHRHRRGGSGRYEVEAARDRVFGSLRTAGPFPVDVRERWFFPRPADAAAGAARVTLRPVLSLHNAPAPWTESSLPKPLRYAVANAEPPRKETDAGGWMSASAWGAYIEERVEDVAPGEFLRDVELADTEHTIGIGIDPERGTQDGVNIYSAEYLRLRDGFRLGLIAEAMDKGEGADETERDLLRDLFAERPRSILVGGQQRVCTATRRDVASPLPLPGGLVVADAFPALPVGKRGVKWTLLTPAIWPEIAAGRKDDAEIHAHPGGWLPNWVDAESGHVLLKAGDAARGVREGREAWRRRVRSMPRIPARLVAAIVPKPIVVTGWALAGRGTEGDPLPAGAKSTHLAVPAGAVYYFEADSATGAASLAAALNWHGTDDGRRTIRNRRSALLGEKGYGLGVCGAWRGIA